MMNGDKTFTDLRSILRFVRIAAWGFGVVLLGWLVMMHFRPTGVMRVRYVLTPDEKPSLLKGFASKEKARIVGTTEQNQAGVFQEITVDPVYFHIPTIRNWGSATISLVYDNPDGQPIIRLGSQTGPGAYAFQVLAAHDSRLDTLRPYWQKLQEGNTTLWQKNRAAYEAYVQRKRELERINDQYKSFIAGEDENEIDITEKEIENLEPVNVEKELETFDYSAFPMQSSFASIADFLNGASDPNRVVTFNYSDELFTVLPNYAPAAKRTTIKKSLRGSHTIVTYVGDNEDLDFRFLFRDINRHRDDDRVMIAVTRGAREIVKQVVTDDGVHDDSNVVLPEREHAVHLAHPGRGVYKIRLTTTDDTFITHIDTQQHRLYFEGKIYLTDNEEYRTVLGEKNFTPTTLYTQGSRVVVRTSHRAGKQTFRVGNLLRTIRSLQEPYAVEDLIGKTPLVFPKNDVFIEGGSFAFSPSWFFADELEESTKLENLGNPIDGYDYILSEDTGVTSKDGVYFAEATVKVPQLKKIDGAYYFLINVPGLSENKRRLRIYEVNVTLRGSPITPSKVFSKATKYLQKLF